MNKIYNPKQENWASLLERPTKTVDDIEATVKEIFAAVQSKGDEAVNQYTAKFDGIALENNLVSNTEIEQAIAAVSDELKAAIQLAKSNIEKFHQAQKTNRVSVETTEGVQCWQEKTSYSKNWIIHSWRNSAFVFNSVDVGYSSCNCWMQRSSIVFASQ